MAPLVRSASRRDPLVGSAFSEGPACQVRFSEGRACHVRFMMLDYPLLFTGHDKRAPPTISQLGGTCLSGPCLGGTRSSGLFFGGTGLSGPPTNVGSSIAFARGLKSRAQSGAKAPHSMECGDLSPLCCEGFSLHHLAICRVFPQSR